MRVNQLTAFSEWMPVAQAMGPMLRTLREHPEKGFLGGKKFFRLFPHYDIDGVLYETIYGKMSIFGLAAATQHVPAQSHHETESMRLARSGSKHLPE
ncbi:DUF4188 domain-containing protein [Leptolyngbya sp. FACHB-16]|nr:MULTISPECIES: DUF4188 domain-containing protein [unclassified Leptolyngbya]MBD1911758.1 DUF4188 domain-containing protein [Leptolyngbya sp. FACHB-8]MBD2158568.1 DUF4188 domain-containing protein [Leptolyngbya sp. FACHB-16]